MSVKKNWQEIGEYVLKIHELGMKYIEGAELFGINVRDIYEYNSRLKKSLRKRKELGGGDSVVESGEVREESSGLVAESDQGVSKGEKAKGSILAEQLEEIILNYRRENPGYGYKRIEEYLKKRYFVVIPRKKIRALLKSHGLTSRFDSSFDRQDEGEAAKGGRRFEALYPGELYQMDVTYVYIPDRGMLYLALIIDDHSRFCVGARLCHDQRSGTMIEVLHEAISRYGKPKRLLTDQGSNFYTWSQEQTIFQRYLDDMEIEHIVADPHSPQTLGKVERLNQTIQRELLSQRKFSGYEEARVEIAEFFHRYNYERVHQGIGNTVPSDRFWGVAGQTARIESELKSNVIDFSRGYLILKNPEHCLSVVLSSEGIQVFLDGNLLQGGKVEEKC